MKIVLKSNLHLLFYSLVLTIFLSGCDDTGAGSEPNRDYNYFPLKLDSPLIYEVSETKYGAGSTLPVISTWFEKDEAVRRSESPEGFPVFTMARSRRNAESEAWQKVKEYSVTQYPDKYLLSIDNITTVPMMFPVRSTTTWDINAFNTKETEGAEYEYVGEAMTVGELHFENTLQVSGRDYTNEPIVRYNLGYSQYAWGVGLVYDEQTDYEYCQEPHCFGQQQIASGVSIKRQLIAY